MTGVFVDGRYLNGSRYDELVQHLQARTLDHASAVTLPEAFSKAFILGTPKGVQLTAPDSRLLPHGP